MKTIIIAAFALTALFNTRAFADTDYTIDLENFCPTALDIQFYSARLGWRIIQLLPGSETQTPPFRSRRARLCDRSRRSAISSAVAHDGEAHRTPAERRLNPRTNCLALLAISIRAAIRPVIGWVQFSSKGHLCARRRAFCGPGPKPRKNLPALGGRGGVVNQGVDGRQRLDHASKSACGGYTLSRAIAA